VLSSALRACRDVALVALTVVSATSCQVPSSDKGPIAESVSRSTPLGAHLVEDRAVLGGRRQVPIVPFRALGAEQPLSSPGRVDPRSVLRLSFRGDGTTDAWAEARIDPARLDEAARTLEDLTTQSRAHVAGALEALRDLDVAAIDEGPALERLAAARAGLDELTRRTLTEPLAREHVDAARIARRLDALGEQRVVVEAFRVQGRSQTALSIAGYNNIASGRVENVRRRLVELDEPRISAARRLLEAERRFIETIDVLRPGLAESGGARPPAVRVAAGELADALRLLVRSAAPAADSAPLAHAYVDLPAAEIDVASNAFQRGDRLLVQVALVEGDSDDYLRENVATWINEIARLGWYRDEALVGVISRGDRGGSEATDWELGFAGATTWSWYQDEDRPLGEIYSWFQPGFGIHLAALDQDDSDLEFGIGVHVSFWEGLLIFGAGSNLTIDADQFYYLIGGDLLGWKDKLTGTSTAR
jgi:hypothetical protein